MLPYILKWINFNIASFCNTASDASKHYFNIRIT